MANCIDLMDKAQSSCNLISLSNLHKAELMIDQLNLKVGGCERNFINEIVVLHDYNSFMRMFGV